MNKYSAGKGDSPRHLKTKLKFDEEYDRIFGNKECRLNHKHSVECGTRIINGNEVIVVDKLGSCFICDKQTNYVSIDYHSFYCCSIQCNNKIIEDLKQYDKHS